jgi:hypothetical protein
MSKMTVVCTYQLYGAAYVHFSGREGYYEVYKHQDNGQY